MIPAIISGVVCLIVGIVIGILIRVQAFKNAEATIKNAEERSIQIENAAIKDAENKKREAILAAQEEIQRERADLEAEIKERRGDLQKQERRLQQKEDNLDRKTDAIEKKEEKLQAKLAAVDKAREEVKALKKSEMDLLERLSVLTAEEAKAYLISQLADEVTHEEAVKLKEIQAKYKEEAETYAREQIALAIQRCAADHVAETTVSVVPLPNDEMKGRIIGREGRNIRTLETLTGAELIIDDTPEAITVSCFDPVRREITRIALERLITDGRIHPARIEEMVEKAKREVEATIKSEGERAVLETNVHGLHPELVKLLGRLHYRTSYGQNVLSHSIEVSHLAGLLAAEIGADVTMAKRAGLLHDLGKSVDHEIEGSHVQIGVDLARRYKENEEVVHAIAAHHNDIEPQTIVACLVQAADAISAARPGARRENVENYIKRLEKLEEISSSFKGVEKAYAIQAGREIRIMVKPDEVDEDRMVLLAREIAKKIEEEMEYPGQIKVNLIRETKAVDYAK
ncbi:MAG: ribonuclease Y [Oscillospiraceae bacterium]|nr:ribonuclease Y [Oscillospiraceae bacterium]